MSRFMRYADLMQYLKGMDARESSREQMLLLDLIGMPEVQGQERPFKPELAALLYTRENHGPDKPETYACRVKLAELSGPRPNMADEEYEECAWLAPVDDGSQPLAPEWVVALVALHAPDWYPRHEECLPQTSPPERRLRSV